MAQSPQTRMFTRRSLQKKGPHFIPASAKNEEDVEMKEAAITVENNVSLKQEDETSQNSQNDISNDKPKKEVFNKLNKKEKRIRRNTRLEKLVRPKNAIMVLNELTNGSTLKFEEIPSQEGLFGMTVTVDGNTYQGFASSKNGAKQKASERALKEYMTSKIRKRQLTGETDSTADVSWSHLASFALHKLLDSWQDASDLLHPEKEKPIPQNTLKPAKALPSNASSMHPVMLLNQMCPGITISDVSCEGQTPNIVYTVQIDFNGISYQGSGANKKSARKNCAQQVMEAHFNVKFDSA